MSRPQLHTSVYPAIAPETIGHANKGKVAVVTGAARGEFPKYPSPGLCIHRPSIPFACPHEAVTHAATPLGIGAAIAEALAKSGADIALLDLDEERQAETKATCEKHGVRARPYACNVLDLKSCERTFAKIQEDLGPVE